MTRTIEDRFWSKVDKRGPDDCWPWTAHLYKGYGKFDINGKKVGSHRVSFKLTHGEIPNDLQVLHKCDNPSCCNPAHLFTGTHIENMQDMVAKGRQAHNHNHNLGEKAGGAKLKESEVHEIRLRCAGGESQVAVGASFGINPGHVSKIVLRKKWAHVEGTYLSPKSAISATSVLSAIRAQLPPKRVRTTIFIDPKLWAAAKRAAPARGMRSAAAVIEAALARYLIQEGLA